MVLPVVLVHGGSHGAWCWDPMLEFLDCPALAVVLPPKRLRTGETRRVDAELAEQLAALKIGDFADSIIADVDRTGFDRFVLVGHSMAGLSIPEVARRIPRRVAHLVFVSATTPPEGACVLDSLTPEIREITRDHIERASQEGAEASGVLDEAMARLMFCNDMDEEQTKFVLDRVCTEAVNVAVEPVTRLGVPPELPKTYVRLSRDQSLPPELQAQMIVNLERSPGGRVEVVEIDAGHDVMVSRPRELAAIVNEIASR
ncbi:MAG TPA: alpha/beta hydrolase [Acidimicrobiia bacterium]|nr:alpha/beta hydrolase [Acidimicrobiia bacterium]